MSPDFLRDDLENVAERVAALERLMGPLVRVGAMTQLEWLAYEVGVLGGQLSRLAERLDALEALLTRSQ
jgi:hypothetical protein